MTHPWLKSWFLFTLCTLPLMAQGPLRQVPDQTLNLLQQNLDNRFIQYELDYLDPKRMRQDLADYGEMELEIMGRWLVLQLQPNELFAPDFIRTITTVDGVFEQPLTEITTYHGHVLGDETSKVSIQVTDDFVSGMVMQGDDVFFLRPASRFVAAKVPGVNVIYRNRDVLPAARATCSMDRHEKDAARLLENLALETKALASNQGYRVQIATETDGEFWATHTWFNINALLAGYVNELDLIWKENLNLRLQLTYQNVFDTSTDPYVGIYGHGPTRYGPHFTTSQGNEDCSDPSIEGLWEQFRDYWNTNRTSVNRDIAVLFTGTDMKLCPTASRTEGELFGTAGDFGTVCTSPRRDYVVMEEYTLNTAGLMAHEIGHSLTAEHRYAVNCGSGGSVVCGTVEAGSDYYSPNNKTLIGNHVTKNHGCLTAIHPEIRVQQSGVVYQDGSTFTFPTTDEGTPVTRNFRIFNDGPAELRIDNPGSIVSGSGFTQITNPPNSLLQGQSALFKVRLTATNAGKFSGAITIQNNDLNEDPYNIALQGTVNAVCGDTTPPTASMTFPSNGQWLNTGAVNLTASASDNVHVVAVAFEVDGQVPGGNADLSAPYSYQWNATAGTHQIRARAMDSCGNIGYSPMITVTVSDTPSTVPNFQARIGGTLVNNQTFYDNTPQINFTWSHASDGSGIDRYQIVLQPQGGPWLYSPHVLYPATSHTLNANLSYGVTYTYHIRAKNNLGNWGAFILAGQFTIQQPTPTTVPNFQGTINGLNVNNLVMYTTSPQVNFTWSHASDPTGIERYQIVLQPTTGGWLYQPHVLYPATSHSIQTSGLQVGTSYSIHIRAKNNAGVWGPFVNGGTFHVQ